MKSSTALGLLLGFFVLTTSATAFGHASKVGLGVALGGTYSPTEIGQGEIGSSFGLGFFVDIPLLETFYISPSTTLRRADLAYVNSGGSMKSLIISLLTSDSFLYRKAFGLPMCIILTDW